MSETNAIAAAGRSPKTIESLSEDLRALGVKPGMVLLVHSSLSSIGWVCGGAVALILALEQTLGEHGTLIMPTHSGDLSDPAAWENPPVPADWWQTIRETMPPYDPAMTPARGVGAVPEVFRRQAGVLRSLHPNYSFAAWGQEAERIVGGRPAGTDAGAGRSPDAGAGRGTNAGAGRVPQVKLDFGMDMDSPLGRIYECDGHVLLLGVTHENNTSMHLAEYLTDFKGKKVVDCHAPIVRNGVREWARYRDVDLNSDDFEQIGAAFEAAGTSRVGRVGLATARLMRQRDVVDFAARWMQEHRGQGAEPEDRGREERPVQNAQSGQTHESEGRGQ